MSHDGAVILGGLGPGVPPGGSYSRGKTCSPNEVLESFVEKRPSVVVMETRELVADTLKSQYFAQVLEYGCRLNIFKEALRPCNCGHQCQ